MHGKLIVSALMGASLVAARPLASAPASPPSGSTSTTTTTTSAATADSTAASTAGFKFPLADGFPAPSKQQLAAIEKQAGGVLDNNPPPPQPQSDSLTSLGLIAFNELFEVAFFTELIQNITNNAPGYNKNDIGPARDDILAVLKTVVAQEQLHALKANGAFNAFTGKTIEPCQYNFPVDSFIDAITLASTFTDVVLSTLPDIQTVFAENNDDGLIRGIGAVIGQEGEQNGFYRALLGKVPSQLPFLTGGARDFAFNAILQNFIVPNSCPSLDLLVSGGLVEYGVLTVETKNLGLEDVTAEFTLEAVLPATTPSTVDYSQSNLYLTYINQQNVPFSVPITIKSHDKAAGTLQVTASFPGKSNDLNGLTIAAVTSGNGPFATADDVASMTVFGPGLIEV